MWASTSTVSGSGDQGADPNKLVEITDRLGATSTSEVGWERFHPVMAATYGQVVEGVSFTPGTRPTDGDDTGPQLPIPEVPGGVPPVGSEDDLMFATPTDQGHMG